MELRNHANLQGADVVLTGGRVHRGRRTLKPIRGPAESETPSRQGNSERGNRETPVTPLPERGGPVGEGHEPYV